MHKPIYLSHGCQVQTWYDRHTRSWVTALKDMEGNQIGDASYDGDKDGIQLSRQAMVDRHKWEYGNVGHEIISALYAELMSNGHIPHVFDIRLEVVTGTTRILIHTDHSISTNITILVNCSTLLMMFRPNASTIRYEKFELSLDDPDSFNVPNVIEHIKIIIENCPSDKVLREENRRHRRVSY